jgi:hypothetical protein
MLSYCTMIQAPPDEVQFVLAASTTLVLVSNYTLFETVGKVNQPDHTIILCISYTTMFYVVKIIQPAQTVIPCSSDTTT